MIIRLSDFFMSLLNHFVQTLETSGQFYTSMSSSRRLLSPELIAEVFKQAGVATVSKRRWPLEPVLWLLVGMSLYRQPSIWKIVNPLDIVLPVKKVF